MPSYNDNILTGYGPTYGPGSVSDVVDNALDTVVLAGAKSIADKQMEVVRNIVGATPTSISDFTKSGSGSAAPAIPDPNLFGV